jgi:hypothetical protein
MFILRASRLNMGTRAMVRNKDIIKVVNRFMGRVFLKIRVRAGERYQPPWIRRAGYSSALSVTEQSLELDLMKPSRPLKGKDRTLNFFVFLLSFFVMEKKKDLSQKTLWISQ